MPTSSAPTSTPPIPRAAPSSCVWSSGSTGCTASALKRAFAVRVAEPLGMSWWFAYANETKRTAVLASRDDHCLLDLLWRWRRHEFETEIVHVISSHPDHARDVGGF